jgi:hypothetical protein
MSSLLKKIILANIAPLSPLKTHTKNTKKWEKIIDFVMFFQDK